MVLRQGQWLGPDSGGFPYGISDLILAETAAGWRLFAASRPSGAGLTAFDVAPDGTLRLAGSQALSAQLPLLGPTRIALVEGWGAHGLILSAGLSRSTPTGSALTADAVPGRRMVTLDGLTGDLVTVESRMLDDETVVIGLDAAGVAPRIWTVGPTGSFTAQAPPPLALSGAPPADLMAASVIGGQLVIITASSADTRLTSYVATPAAGAQAVQTLGQESGLGFSHPSALEILSAGGQHWVIVAGAGSNSLTVLRLAADGRMVPVFHAIDSLHSRFDAAAALAVATVAGRGYVATGGGDDGISLFLLLPGGRLLHLDAFPWGAQSPGPVSALTMRPVQAADGAQRLDIMVAGQQPGLARLVADLGRLAEPMLAPGSASTLQGGADGDLLIGGNGPVTLSGGAGDDILVGGTGRAVMTGGAGRDLFVPAANGQTTRITDFDPAEDRIDLSAFPMLRDFGQIGLTPTASGARLVWRETILEVTTPLRRPLREADFGLDPLGGATPLPIAEPARPAGLRRDGSTGPDRLTGGSGDDLLIGGAGHDTLAGEDGNDSLVGAEGNDRLDGGRGSDTLEGGPGNDRYVIDSAGDVIADEVGFSQGGGIDTVEAWVSHTLPRNVEILRLQGDANLNGTGNAAPEALVGNRGGNRLDGAGGNDVLNGKDGNDTLIGGLGADTLVGEAGRDVFVFRSVAESRPGLTGRDFINGFQVGIDRIDLSAIDANPVLAGDQAFVFIGTAAFSGQPGQLRHFTFGPGGFCIVEADVNGDRVADMQIFVNQTGFVLAGDFLL